MNNYSLMLPGPVEVSPQVLAKMAHPMVAHFGDEFNTIYFSLRNKLKTIFRTRGKVWVMPGSGSTALDTGIVNLAAAGEDILVCVNGFFGEVLLEMAEAHGITCRVVEAPRGEPIDPEDVRKALKENPGIKAVYIIYSESSTGIANPVAEVGEVVRDFDALYFVDAVSAVGGMELDMDGWNIDFCAGGSQKCLGAPPGIAICAVGERAMEYIRSRKNIRSWQNNLSMWDKYEDDPVDPYPLTLPGNIMFALDQGVEHIFQEGLEQCIERHREISRFVREGLTGMGARPVGNGKTASATVTAAFMPEGINPPDVVDYLAEKYEIMIRGGLGDFGSKIIRIGHMAYVARYRFVVPVLHALEDALEHLGPPRN